MRSGPKSGQYTEPETGYQYLRARYYDPTTGQFLTRDPLEAQTREPYGYVGGNPLNRIDATGFDWWNPSTWTPVDWLQEDACIAIGSPNCQSIADQHLEAMQHVVDFVGGVLDV